MPPVEDEDLCKVQVWVSRRDKRAILSAVGDDGVFTFVIRTQFKRLANYVTTNDLKSYDPTDFDRFVNFVCNGSNTCVDRTATIQHESRTAKGLQHQDATAKSKSGSVSTGRATRVRSNKQDKG